MVLLFHCPFGQEHLKAGIWQRFCLWKLFVGSRQTDHGKERESGMLYSEESLGLDSGQNNMQLFVCPLKGRPFGHQEPLGQCRMRRRCSIILGCFFQPPLIDTLVSIVRVRKESPSVQFLNLEQGDSGKKSHLVFYPLGHTLSVHVSNVALLLFLPP